MSVARRRKASREDVVARATEMFLAHERVDLLRLAQELGLGRTTLYRWFGDRERLLDEILGDLNRAAWEAMPWDGNGGLRGFMDAVDRYTKRTVTFAPMLHFARSEPAAAIRVITNPDGRIRRDLVGWIGDALAEHAEPGSYAPETPDVLVELSIALMWTPITSGREPDPVRLRRLLNALAPPARAA